MKVGTMTVLEFIDGLVRSLVWPICIAVVVIVFRVQLRSIVSKAEDRVPFLRSVKVGSAEMSFSDQMHEVLQESASTAMTLSGSGQADAIVEVEMALGRAEMLVPTVTGNDRDDLDLIRSFARFNPNAALIAMGAYMESLLRVSFQREFPARRDDTWVMGMDDVATALREAGRDADTMETAIGLINLGNRTQADNPVNVNTSADALSLIDVFAPIARYIESPRAPQ